jgi:hypothetical protein
MKIKIYDKLKPFLTKAEYEKLNKKYNLNKLKEIYSIKNDETITTNIGRLNRFLIGLDRDIKELDKNELKKTKIYQIIYEFAVSGNYDGSVHKFTSQLKK